MAGAPLPKVKPGARIIHFKPMVTAPPLPPARISLLRGVLLGVAAAVLVSMFWGMLAYQAQPVLAALLAGYVIAVAVSRGTGRLTAMGAVAASVLSVLAVIVGDILYFSFSAARELRIPVSYDLVSGIARDIAALEVLDGNLITALVAVLGGAALGLYTSRTRVVSIPEAAAIVMQRPRPQPTPDMKGAVEGDHRGDPTPVSMSGQLTHRTTDEMLKDSDTDLPG